MIVNLIIIIITTILINNKVPTDKISNNIKLDNNNYLQIKKINLKQNFYKDKRNNIEENIQVLNESKMPDEENNILIIAAHSGDSNISYFNNLINLELNDEVIIHYKSKTYKYYVIKIWEENKTGKIHINYSLNNQLILTTCHPNKLNKQLVISAIKKRVI